MSTKLQHTDTPRIYVASLSDYNAGRLHGRWIDADQDADAIRAEIAAMLADSREPIAEEWAIHDYDNFAGYEVPEYADPDTVSEIACLISEHGRLFVGLLDYFSGDVERARDYIDRGAYGAYRDVGEYAYEMTNDLYGDVLESLPSFIRHHIDWDGVAEDLDLGGDIFIIEADGKVYVFDSHL